MTSRAVMTGRAGLLVVVAAAMLKTMDSATAGKTKLASLYSLT